MNINEALSNLRETDGDLASRAAKSSIWIFITKYLARIFSLLKLIILARLLNPNDFGILGIAILTLNIANTFSQIGLQTWLIHKSGDIKPYLDLAWTASLIRGLVLFIIIFSLAPYAAAFFGASDAAAVIKVISLSVLLSGATNVSLVYFQKELQFQKLFKYELIGALADFIVSVILAIALRNVWALALGLLAGDAVRVSISFLLYPYRPRFDFKPKQIIEMFHYGKWIMGSSIMLFLSTQGDGIFVGKFLGAATLGLYQMASNISNLPATEIGVAISQISLPLYSKLKSDLKGLKNAYLNILKINNSLSTLIAVLIITISPEFTKLLMGEKWMPIVPIMQVLVLAGVARSISSCSCQLFFAVGKPEVEARWQFFRLIALIIMIYPLSLRYGMIGVALAVLLSILISNIGFALNALKIIELGAKDLLSAILIPIICGIITILFVTGIKQPVEPDLLRLIIAVVTSISSYLILLHVSDIVFNYGIMSIAREYIKKVIIT